MVLFVDFRVPSTWNCARYIVVGVLSIFVGCTNELHRISGRTGTRSVLVTPVSPAPRAGSGVEQPRDCQGKVKGEEEGDGEGGHQAQLAWGGSPGSSWFHGDTLLLTDQCVMQSDAMVVGPPRGLLESKKGGCWWDGREGVVEMDGGKS